MKNQPSVVLNNGVEMPLLGLGLFRITNENGGFSQCIHDALEEGYRFFDTAEYYENEKDLGEALASSGLHREEYFVTTKLTNDNIKLHDTRNAFFRQLERLKMDYIDLYLIHWPVKGYEQAWVEMEKLYEEKRIRAIGISNGEEGHLNRLWECSGIVPAVDQVEMHPYKAQLKLRKICAERGIVAEAYGPFMQGELLSDSLIGEIARKYHNSPAQIILRWFFQQKIPVIPKTVTRERMMQNRNAMDFVLEEVDMEILHSLNKEQGSFPSPYEVI